MGLTIPFGLFFVALIVGAPVAFSPGIAAVANFLHEGLPVFAAFRRIMTETVSGAFGVIYAIVVSALACRPLKWSAFIEAVSKAVRTTALVIIIVGGPSATSRWKRRSGRSGPSTSPSSSS